MWWYVDKLLVGAVSVSQARDRCWVVGRHHQHPHILTPRETGARPSGRGAQAPRMPWVEIAPVADLSGRDVTQPLLPNHNHGIWYSNPISVPK
jgi:hypothetical protein